MERTVADAAADLRLSNAKLAGDLAATKRKVLSALSDLERAATIKLKVDTAGVTTAVGVTARELRALNSESKLSITATNRDAVAAVAEVRALLDSIGGNAKIAVSADIDNAAAELAALESTAKSVDGHGIVFTADVDAAIADIAALKSAIASVPTTVAITFTGNSAGATSAAASTAAAAAGAHSTSSNGSTAAAEQGLSRLVPLVSTFGAGIAAAGAGVGALTAGITTFGLKAAATLEQTIASFKNILGTQQAADKLFGTLQDLADVSPFETQTLADAAKSLLAIGVTVDDVTPTVENLAGIVSLLGGASSESFGRLTLALGQIRTATKPMTQDLFQIQNALPGFNASLELAKGVAEKYGIGVQEAMAKVKDGSISGQESFDILLQRMQAFPGAATAVAAQAATLQGKLSTFSDVVKRSLVDSFLPVTTLVKEGLDPLTTNVQHALDAVAPAIAGWLQKLIPKVGPLVEAVGVSLAPAIEGLINGVSGVLDGLVPVIAKIGPPLGEIFTKLGEFASNAGPAVAGGLGTVLSVLEALSSVLASIPTPVLSVLVDGFIAMKVATGAAGAVQQLAGTLSSLASGTSSAASGLTLLNPAILAATAAVTVGITMWQNHQAQMAAVKARTDEASAALEAQVGKLSLLGAAYRDSAGNVDAFTAAQSALGAALVSSGADGEKLTVSLNNIGISPTGTKGMQSLVTVLSQIGAFGKADGDVSKVPEIMSRLTKEFGDNATEVANVISKTDDLKSIFGQLTDVNYGVGITNLTESQKGLVKSIEELQDQAEKTDLANIITQMLQTEAAADGAKERTLAMAEGLTGVSRYTKDAADAQTLLAKSLELEGGALADQQKLLTVTNPALLNYSEGLALTQGNLIDLGATMGATNPMFLNMAEYAARAGIGLAEAVEPIELTKEQVQALNDAVNALLSTFNMVSAEQSFKAVLDDVSTEGTKLIDAVRKQFPGGVGMAIVAGDTEETRKAFQDVIGPLVTEGSKLVQQTLDQQGPTAAAAIAVKTRDQIIYALAAAGLSGDEAASIAEMFFNPDQFEATAAQASGKAIDSFKQSIGDGEIPKLRLDADIEPAKAKLTDRALTDPKAKLRVEADTTDATNKIKGISNQTIPVTLHVSSVTGTVGTFRLRNYREGGIEGRGLAVTPVSIGGREHHVAQIAPAGAWRVWAEDETGGEGYIPMAPSKRARSTAVLRYIAEDFGYELVRRTGRTDGTSAGGAVPSRPMAVAAWSARTPDAGATAAAVHEALAPLVASIAPEAIAEAIAQAVAAAIKAPYDAPRAVANRVRATMRRQLAGIS